MSDSSARGLLDAQNLYEILEVRPEAGPQEIRAAYLRAKASFQRDSLALYSLLDGEDAAYMLRQIEEAFLILSNPDRKRLYDQSHMRGSRDEEPLTPRPAAQVISIDRVPPMSASASADDLLIPPSTDFSGTLASESAPPAMDAVKPATSAMPAPTPPTAPTQPLKSAPAPVSSVGSGPELRDLRERKGVSIDYLVEITRIRKTYLMAVEAENFEVLPAAVYIRGFLSQMARELQIPSEPLVTEYLKRHAAWRASRELSPPKK
jgi:hypothetical protein